MSDPIKTYRQVHPQHSLESFGISRMEDIYEKRKGKADAPHRHDYFTILLIAEGKGAHLIDFNEYPIQPSQAFFIAPMQVHQVIEAQRGRGYSIVFSEDFLLRNHIPLSFLDELSLFQDYDSCPPLPLTAAQLSILSNYCEEMIELYQGSNPFRERGIIALLELFLIRSVSCSQEGIEALHGLSRGKELLREFKQLINRYYAEWHSSSQYAEALAISADHLNRVVKQLTQKTAKEHIQARIAMAGKHMLFSTSAPIKEIAHELGFSEPANFSAFFKKQTGLSPAQFKKKHFAGF